MDIKLAYKPELDGLRAVAVATVMLFHARLLDGGYLGVDVFFVLSGYLITSLLIAEINASGTVDLKRFYIRRLLRLYPALVLFLLIYLATAPFLWPEYYYNLRDSTLAFFYLSDYSYAFYGIPDRIRHTWSLAVEVHYYLLWPFVVMTIFRWPGPALILIVGYLLATLWRVHDLTQGQWIDSYYRFDMRLSGLILGSALAVLRLQMKSFWGLVGLACMIIAMILLDWRQADGIFQGVMIVELGSLLIIASRPPLLNHRFLVYIGKLSYGLYLYHYPIMYYLRVDYDPWTTFIAGSTLSFMLAWMSYHTVETWAGKFRTSSRRQARHTKG